MNIDPLLFPALKAATDPETELAKIKNTITGSRIDSVGRHGKYFWMRMSLGGGDSATGVLLMHLGMTGMIKLRNISSHLTFMENGGDKKVLEAIKEKKRNLTENGKTVSIPKDDKVEKEAVEVEKWPPKFVKFELDLSRDDGKTILLAFVDARRLGRVRLLEGPSVQTNEDLLQESPLNALGPDYSKSGEGNAALQMAKAAGKFVFGDPDPSHHGRPRLLLEEFNKVILLRNMPIKSLLLDQSRFAGVGNWVADEILFHARIHPSEVISAKVPPEGVSATVETLYKTLIYVTEYAVSVEGDVSQFPDTWLMPHRWGKARKEKSKTKDGYEVDYLTVGGRTAGFVPKLQKLMKCQSGAEGEVKKEKVANSAVAAKAPLERVKTGTMLAEAKNPAARGPPITPVKAEDPTTPPTESEASQAKPQKRLRRSAAVRKRVKN